MASRETLLRLGDQEIGNSVTSNPKRVLEYLASYPQFAGYDEGRALKTSWCQCFCNWLLKKAGFPTMTRSYAEWVAAGKDQKDDGFQYLMARKPYVPRPGDIYYSPTVGGKTTHHMGFIVKVLGPDRYKTLDGNAGGPGHEHYDKTLWTGSSSGSLQGGMGGGVVCYNERNDNGGADIGISCFLKLPLMIYTQNPYG